MSDEEILTLIVAVMLRQWNIHAGVDTTNWDIKTGVVQAVPRFKQIAPRLYSEMRQDAAAIMSELEKAKVVIS